MAVEMHASARLRTKLQDLSRGLEDDEWGILHMVLHLAESAMSMQEEAMSFNMQYLQLQDEMANENRQFTTVSNIMKTKHDTVRNSISNIREWLPGGLLRPASPFPPHVITRPSNSSPLRAKTTRRSRQSSCWCRRMG